MFSYCEKKNNFLNFCPFGNIYGHFDKRIDRMHYRKVSD